MPVVQGFDQGFIPIKFVNTNVDYKNILFDNHTHGVKISRTAMPVRECVMCFIN